MNGQVDHRDLLNIGFLHGTTGPERADAATDFAAQLAPVWPGILPGGTNHAEVDAEIWDLRVATLGEERAKILSVEDGKRSPVELY